MTQGPVRPGVIDAHAHFFSHGFFKGLMAQRPGVQGTGAAAPPTDEQVTGAVRALGLEPPAPDPVELAGRWVTELDRHGVQRMAIMASLPSDWASVRDAVLAWPDRLTAYLMVDPRAETTTKLVDEALETGLLKGLCLFPAMHRFHVYDDCVRRLVERVQPHGTVMFCHFGILKIPLRGKLGVPSRFDGTYAVPTDLHRLAANYPGVNFQVPHFGAGYLRETLYLGDQLDNVYTDTSSSNAWMRLHPPSLDLMTVLRQALDAFGYERILWGSDSGVFPRGWRRDLYELQLGAFRSLSEDETALHAIFGGNAARVWGLGT